MNKIIRVKIHRLSPLLKLSIKKTIDRLEKDNFSEVSNPTVIRLIPRYIPKVYKDNNILLCKSGVIFLKPTHYLERINDYSFRIRKH